MITKEELKKIISDNQPEQLSILEVIRKYIYDRKGVDVKQIKQPSNIIQIQLMNIAYNSAILYYTEKFDNERKENSSI